MSQYKTRDQLQKERLDAMAAHIGGTAGEELAAAWEDYCALYPLSLIDWFAGLYDPRIGGYYHSESGRDNEPFLPDVESTLMALGFISDSGLAHAAGGSYANVLPDWMKTQLGNFVYNLQDPDGFFYHPQWGKNIGLSRRARDLTWSLNTLKALGITPKYNTVLNSPADGASTDTLIPEHLSSKEKFLTYLESKNIRENSYPAGHEISQQSTQIMACGLMDVCIDFLNAHQHPDTGLWHTEKNYYAINGLMKISGIYTRANLPLPHAAEAAFSAMDAITSEEPMTAVVDLFNTWFAVGNLVRNLRSCGGDEGGKQADGIVRLLRKNAPRAIRRSREKISAFQTPDGSFTYSLTGSSGMSQGAPVDVKGNRGGNINATMLSSTGMIGRAVHALELVSFAPPLYGDAEWQRYLAILEKNRKNN